LRFAASCLHLAFGGGACIMGDLPRLRRQVAITPHLFVVASRTESPNLPLQLDSARLLQVLGTPPSGKNASVFV
jgi:hypothetical protein